MRAGSGLISTPQVGRHLALSVSVRQWPRLPGRSGTVPVLIACLQNPPGGVPCRLWPEQACTAGPARFASIRARWCQMWVSLARSSDYLIRRFQVTRTSACMTTARPPGVTEVNGPLRSHAGNGSPAARWHRGLAPAVLLPGLPSQSYRCGAGEDHHSAHRHQPLRRAAQQRNADDHEHQARNREPGPPGGPQSPRD